MAGKTSPDTEQESHFDPLKRLRITMQRVIRGNVRPRRSFMRVWMIAMRNIHGMLLSEHGKDGKSMLSVMLSAIHP
eukprot:5212601-Amphidinium_carterae.1